MKLHRLLLRAACAFVCAMGATPSTTVLAQAYPSKPVGFIVSTAPGGSPDILARIGAQVR